MKPFVEMAPEDVWKLVEGQVDVIAPALAREAGAVKPVCSRCGSSSVTAATDPRRPFLPGAVLSNKLWRCNACSNEQR